MSFDMMEYNAQRGAIFKTFRWILVSNPDLAGLIYHSVPAKFQELLFNAYEKFREPLTREREVKVNEEHENFVYLKGLFERGAVKVYAEKLTAADLVKLEAI